MRRFSFFLSFAVVVIIQAGCKGGCGCSTAERPRFVVVLLDETGSFQVDTTRFWPEVIQYTVKIVQTLQPGEGIGVIGIDDHGFDSDDIRIPMTVLDENALRASQQKRELARGISALSPRKLARPYTDIVGSLRQAANTLNGMTAYRGVIAIFSDMIQTPGLPGLESTTGLSFPNGTSVYCFYVDATRERPMAAGKLWETLVATWSPIFERVGLEYKTEEGRPHFYERGNTQIAFDKIFSR
jgi:hypothetical protein